MVEIGHIAIIASFLVTMYSTFVGFAGGMLNGRDLASSARWGFYSVVPLLLVATMCLISVSYTHLTLPTICSV